MAAVQAVLIKTQDLDFEASLIMRAVRHYMLKYENIIAKSSFVNEIGDVCSIQTPRNINPAADIFWRNSAFKLNDISKCCLDVTPGNGNESWLSHVF